MLLESRRALQEEAKEQEEKCWNAKVIVQQRASK